MRKQLVIVGLIAVAACKGQGPDTAGSTAAPAGSGTAAVPVSEHSFVKPTETKTYQAQGAVQSFGYDYVERVKYDKPVVKDAAGNVVLDDLGFPKRQLDESSRTLLGSGQDKQLYAANAGTVRDPKISVAYDPRNAQFTLTINQNNVSNSVTFQDPAHRTNFGGALHPQSGVPDLTTDGVKYLQVDNGSGNGVSDVVTFFYQQPGTSTKYVTYAGYVRNRFEAPAQTNVTDSTTTLVADITRKTLLERATFVYGEQTATNAVPKTGTASFAGSMIASVVNNPTFENGTSTYFQWMSGTATVGVDFAAGTLTTSLTGTTLAPFTDPTPLVSPTAGIPSILQSIPAGATFAAAGTGRIDLVGTGGFTGQFQSASFTSGSNVQNVTIAGSSLDGAFYGPKAEEIGATFRIVGGVPDQRVDIIGGFTGVKK